MTQIVNYRPYKMGRADLLRWIKNNRTEFVEPPYEGMDGDCWIYTGRLNNAGYGTTKFQGRKQYVHRLSLAEKLNRELDPGEEARHLCDRPACFSPRHLTAGTSKDNTKDMYQRGRDNHAQGERNGQTKLTAFQVRRIRQLHASGVAKKALARQFGVTPATIRSAILRRTWKHLS